MAGKLSINFLFWWHLSRNASLGHGDTDDRTHPEQVVLKHHEVGEDSKILDDISFKLQAAMVWDVQMSRLHTGVMLPLLKYTTGWYHALWNDNVCNFWQDWPSERFSTVVLTDESRANIHACGFASSGRHVASISLLCL
jgi:hypothetical protein